MTISQIFATLGPSRNWWTHIHCFVLFVIFINNNLCSHNHYETACQIELLHNPSDPLLSFNQVKCHIQWLLGVVPLEYDMCPNSCVTFTGPYSNLVACPHCLEPCYVHGSTTKAQKCFSTILISPVIQAFYGSCAYSKEMQSIPWEEACWELWNSNCDWWKTGGIWWHCLQSGTAGCLGQWPLQKDWYRTTVFYRWCPALSWQIIWAWVFIWVIHSLPPELCYKKAFVIPGAIIPGPNKPGGLNSILFSSLYHVAVLQHEGLQVYNAYLNVIIPCTTPTILFGTANSLSSAAMSGMVGHSGRYGCCLYCEMPGWHCIKDTHYYLVMKLPHSYTVHKCCHADVSVNDLIKYCKDLPWKYHQNINHLLASDSEKQFKEWCLNIGLCKQTFFSGLPVLVLPVLSIFTMNIMHLSALNDPDLFMKLFTGKLDVCQPNDWDT